MLPEAYLKTTKPALKEEQYVILRKVLISISVIQTSQTTPQMEDGIVVEHCTIQTEE